MKSSYILIAAFSMEQKMIIFFFTSTFLGFSIEWL